MKNFNFLSSLGRQSSGLGIATLASTVGSPSAHRRGAMLKSISVLMLVLTLGVGQMWGALTNSYTKVTSVTDLADGDVVVLATESSSLPSVGVSGQNGTNDAAVSTTESEWVQYEITLVKSGQTITGWTLYNPTLEKYVQSPTGNHFKHGTTGGTCSVKTSSGGQYTFTCNSRYLQKNGNYYRMYNSINDVYTPFYVWKVASSCSVDPTVGNIMNNVSGITASGATFTTSSGVSAGSNCTLSEVGFVYGTSSNPTITTGTKATIANYSSGNLSKSVTGLNDNTTYYVRAFATNGHGTVYSDQKSFKTLELSKYTVSFVTGEGNSTQAAITEASVGAGITLPAAPSTIKCSGDGWEFAGWSETNVASETGTAPTLLAASSSYSPNADVTLYAVYRHASVSSESSSVTYTLSGNWTTNNGNWTKVDGSDLKSTLASGKYGLDSGSSTAVSPVSVTDISEIKFTGTKSNTGAGTVAFYYGSGNSWTLIESKSFGTSLTWSPSPTVTGQLKCVFSRSAGNIYIASIKVTGKFPSYTYISAPDCCTELGSVTGTISSNSPTSVTLSWSTVTGAEKYQVKVPGSSSHNAWTDVNTTSVTVTKSCGTAYTAYFKAIDTNGSHCTEGPESTLAIPAQSWAVTSTGVTHATASPAIPATTCNGFCTTITAATGYALPSEITVTNADKTWNNSTGALTISNVTGNVTITIAGTCAAPNITVHPASANYVADPNASATALSVTATAAGADLDYQWQSKVDEGNWTNIQGATNSTYTPSRTSAGVTQYQVIVTNHVCSSSRTSDPATITVTAPSVCIAPTFTPAAGTYTGTQSVALSSETTDASVYYTITTDGTEPATPTSGSTAYSSAISVTQNTRIKAIAIKDGMQASDVVEAAYLIKCETPTFTPSASTPLTGTQSVTIACETGGATIYYTTDGTDPDNTKTAYSGAFNVASNQTVKAIAIKSGMENSAIATAAYQIKCETPTFSPAAGEYTGAQNVTITSATDGATIYYTTDGSDPDNTKTAYSGAFSVASNQTVKAIAIKSGMENSAIGSAAYTIQYAVKWYVGGTEEKNVVETTYVTAGSKVAPPTDPLGTAIGACANTFMGWTTSEYRNGSVPQTAEYYETPLFKKATASASLPTISEATSYYAVFATSEDGTTKQTFTPGTDTGETSVTKGTATCTMTTMNNASYYQIYANQSGTFSCSSGNVTKIEFTCTASGTSKYGPGNASADVGTYSYDGSTGTWTGSANSVTISSTAQVRMTSLEVIYESVNIKDYVTECAAVDAPTFSVDPADGPFNVAQSVELDCETDGATIYYTTDGSTPSDASTEYTGAITVNEGMTIKAIAIKGSDESDVAEAVYTFKVVTPTITSSPKHFLSKTKVSIASTAGATIYYTTDGTTPTTESSVYSIPFEISANATITAYAVKSGWTDSEKSESVTFTKVEESAILTVAQARSVIDGGTNLNGRYVHGKIYNVASYNSDHHSMVYWISDDGTGTVSNKDGLEIFNGLSGDYKAQFEGIGDLSVGDEVIVWGNLYKYNSTYELNQNNEIAKLMRDVTAPTFTPAGGGFLTTQHVTIASEEGATIYYTTNGDEPTNESTLYTNAGIDLSATTTIKAIAYKDEYNSVVITKKYTKGGTPLTVAEALAALDSNNPIDDQFVTGKVCTAPASAPSNGQLTYYIVDDLDDIQSDNKLQVYKGKDLGGANFDAQNDIQFGDVVTVFGQLKIHQGTKELNENNHLVAFDRPTYLVTEVSVDPTSATIEVGEHVDLTATVLPTYATDKSVEWSSSASGVASVENGVVTGVSYGTAVITVTAQDGSNVAANCTITVYQWNLSGYTVTSEPATEYTEIDHFSKASVAIQANYVRSDNPELTQDEDVAASAWSAKLGGNAIADNYQFQLADDGKTLALYVGENKVWEETISVAEAPKDQFVVGIWDVAAPEEQNGTYTMPSLSDQTAAEGNCKDHNIFIGWVEEANADDLIDDNIIAGGATGIVAANKTYHAVWAKQVTGPRNFSIKYDWDGLTTGWGTSGSWSTNNNGKSGKCGSVSSAESIYTISSYAKPKTFSVYLKRTSGNTTNSWKIQYSKNNSTWTDIQTIDFEDISNSDWSTLISVDVSAEDYNDCYFKLVKSGNANCLVDDVTLVYESTGTYNTDYRVDCSQRYTLSFDANGGSGSYDDVEKRENATVTLPDGSALSLEYNDFAGWKVYYANSDHEDPENEIAVTNNQFSMPASNVEAVAQWTEQAKGTISYVGEEIQNSSITRYAGQTYKLRTEVTLPANKKLVGWTIDGDETLYAPNQEMTMPTPVQDITYHVQIIDIVPEPKDMDISTGEWILVTNENQLHAGDFVVIVGNETTNAMSAQGNNFRDVAGVTKQNEGQNITLSNDVTPLFLQNGYMDGEFALYDMAYEKDEVVVGGYLYANSSSNNQMQTSNTYSSRDYSWKITIGDGNVASIVAQGANTRNVMQYNPNNGSPRFACYGSASLTGLQLYRYEGQLDVEITEDASTSTVYVENANVTVKEDVTLTIDASSTLGDLTVENGGKVAIADGKELDVQDFYIGGTHGKSGQVMNAENLNVDGDAYFDFTLGVSGETAANQWHNFSVPFPVNAINGVYGWRNDQWEPLTNEVDYAIEDYHGEIRAEGNYGWKKFRGTMTPGHTYSMTVNGDIQTYRFKKSGDYSFVADPTVNFSEHASSDSKNAGWNGLGNMRLCYSSISNTNIAETEVDEVLGRYVLVLDAESYTYKPYALTNINLTVGSAFFIQASGNGTMDFNEAQATVDKVYAPARTRKQIAEPIMVTMSGERGTDHMYISADEDATSTYQIGRDMQRMFASSNPTTPLIYTMNYGGLKLAAEDAPLVNDQAVYTLQLYAPIAGEYTLKTDAVAEADVYLTYQGTILWNISESEYTVELGKGKTDGYGLLLLKKAPAVVTGVETVTGYGLQVTGVQKIVIDDHVFILRGGQMYDVNGKMVK